MYGKCLMMIKSMFAIAFLASCLTLVFIYLFYRSKKLRKTSVKAFSSFEQFMKDMKNKYQKNVGC